MVWVQFSSRYKKTVARNRLISQKYAQIEKEGLATTWACKRFQDYLIGLEFHIEMDHKPLVPLYSNKNLDELPPRILRFRMRLMRFNFTIAHVLGKSLITADALSPLYKRERSKRSSETECIVQRPRMYFILKT